MDSFFEPPPAPPPPEDHEHVPPPWFEPPRDVLAGLVADRRVLVRAGPLTIVQSHVDAFPTGCSLRLRIVAVRGDDADEDAWWRLHDALFDRFPHGRHRPGRAALPEGMLRFGVQFADGRKATTLDEPHRWQRQEPPSGPVLTDREGGGGGGDRYASFTRQLWLWPLPPAEPFDLVLEWAAVGVPLTRVELDGGAIAAAAARARPLRD